MNKIEYGLCNVHYSKITESDGGITYGAPVAMPGAVKMTLSALGASKPFYADNIEYFRVVSNNGYEGELELAILPQTFRTDVLGEETDENDVLYESSTAQPQPFALLFEIEGDVTKTKFVFYNVMPSRANMDAGTKAEEIEIKTNVVPIVARPAKDTGLVRARTGADTPAAVLNGWYTAVHLADSEE